MNLMQNIDLIKKWNIKKRQKIILKFKYGKEILTFGDTEIEKTIFIAIKVLFLRNIENV